MKYSPLQPAPLSHPRQRQRTGSCSSADSSLESRSGLDHSSHGVGLNEDMPSTPDSETSGCSTGSKKRSLKSSRRLPRSRKGQLCDIDNAGVNENLEATSATHVYKDATAKNSSQQHYCSAPLPQTSSMTRILKWVLLSRLWYLSVALIFRSFFSEDDLSGNLLFMPEALPERLDLASAVALPKDFASPKSIFERLPRTLIHWDSVHFFSVIHYGVRYIGEIQTAFFPLLPLYVHHFSALLYRVFSARDAPPLDSASLKIMQANVGIMFSLVSGIAATLVLYKLILRLTRKPHVAMASALLFAFQPAAIIQIAMYTEAPFALLTFSGMLLFVERRWFLASLCWGFSTGTRSNGILYVIFFAHRFLFHEHHIRFFLYSLIVIAWFTIYQAYNYYNFCYNLADGTLPRPWCSAMPPLAYSFVQSQYWKVGLFNSIINKQIESHLISLPMTIRSYVLLYQAYWKPALCETPSPSSKIDNDNDSDNDKDSDHEYSSLKRKSQLWLVKFMRLMRHELTPFALTQLVLTVYTQFVAHPNIALRIFSAMPIIFIAQSPSSALHRLWLLYTVIFSTAGACLFSLYYGPT